MSESELSLIASTVVKVAAMVCAVLLVLAAHADPSSLMLVLMGVIGAASLETVAGRVSAAYVAGKRTDVEKVVATNGNGNGGAH